MKLGLPFPPKFLVLGFTVLCSTRALGGSSDVVYDIADLGTLGGPTSAAFAINNRGQVAGSSTLPGAATTHAFLYSEGRMIDLGTLAGGNSEAHAVNDSGDAAGFSDETPFLYRDGAMQDLGTLGGPFGTAYGINGAGWVAGYSHATFFGDRDTHAFLFCIGEMIDLGTLGGSTSFGLDVNDAGMVVGFSGIGTEGSHAFLYDGRMIDLGPGVATAINRKGQVTGYDGGAFLYDGVRHELGCLQGGGCEPWSINDAGKIVGTAYFADGPARAFLYDGSRFVDLNTLIPQGSRWFLYSARGINNSGQIVGLGNHAARDRAFLLTPRRRSRE